MRIKIVILSLFAFLLVLLKPNWPNQDLVLAQTTCQTQTDQTKARVIGGLISAKQINTASKINSPDGKCILSPQAVLRFEKLPTFEKLKRTYFDQAKNTGSFSKTTLSGGSNLTPGLSTDTMYYVDGNLTINSPASGTKTGVFFVKDDLFINQDLTYAQPEGGLVFIVQRNIYISSNVKNIDAFLITTGNIYTAADNGIPCLTSGVTTKLSGGPIEALTVNGSLISLSTSGSIRFCRKIADITKPSEIMKFQAKYLIILGDMLPGNEPIWKEVP
jgi:hypothetical protein